MYIYPIYNHDNICYYPIIGINSTGDRMIEDKDVKPIKGFDGYFITEDGVVYSDKYKKNRRVLVNIKYNTTSSGVTYKYVLLYNNLGYRKKKYVHRLVYETFNNVILNKNTRIYFKDYNCFNCHINNLSTKCDPYFLEKNEKWLEGYEGRYFLLNGEIYSVLGEHPKKLTSRTYGAKRKYELYDDKGNQKSYYLS